MKMSFQWFFDLSTVPEQMQIVTVHAGGEMVRERLAPFFQAYKYYKLGRVKVSFVPASTLPVDPTGLSYEEGENTVDPRDQLTPGLTRITNGEDIYEKLTGLSADEQRRLYYTMMLDRRWFKFGLQRGFKKSAIPLYWQLGQYHQDYFPGADINFPHIMTPEDASAPIVDSTSVVKLYSKGESGFYQDIVGNVSTPKGIFQTGHKGRLSWLPTDALIDVPESPGGHNDLQPANNPIAQIELFKIITPPAIKTKYYWRVYVTETVYFKSPVLNNLAFDVEDAEYCYSSLDRFVRASMPRPERPVSSETPDKYAPVPPNDGAGVTDGDSPIPPGPDPPGPTPPEPIRGDDFPTDAELGDIFIPDWIDEFTTEIDTHVFTSSSNRGWFYVDESGAGTDRYFVYCGYDLEINQTGSSYNGKYTVYGSHLNWPFYQGSTSMVPPATCMDHLLSDNRILVINHVKQYASSVQSCTYLPSESGGKYLCFI